MLHICDAPSIEEMKIILKSAAEGDLDQALKKMRVLYENGHSSFDISNGFYKILSDMEG